jgi:hypothetical protein
MAVEAVYVLLPISMVRFSPASLSFNVVRYRRNPYLQSLLGHRVFLNSLLLGTVQLKTPYPRCSLDSLLDHDTFRRNKLAPMGCISQNGYYLFVRIYGDVR